MFEKVQKKLRFGLDFGKPKLRKIYKNMLKNGVQKCIFFGTPNFKRCLSDFVDFGSILGGPRTSKNHQKFKKIEQQSLSGRTRSAFRIWVPFWERFGSDIERFLTVFKRILEVFKRILWNFNSFFAGF